jgi:hypothetical protein
MGALQWTGGAWCCCCLGLQPQSLVVLQAPAAACHGAVSAHEHPILMNWLRDAVASLL